MTTTTSAVQSPVEAPATTATGLGYGARAALVAIASVVIAVVAALLPAWPAGEDMGSTHYMGLLAANQPWNLLLFMAVPVIAAETVAITELVLLFTRGAHYRAAVVNKYVGAAAGFYFLGVSVYLLVNAVIPLTTDNGWRGPADVIAVGFYLAGLIPLYGMTLLETRVIGTGLSRFGVLKLHAVFVGIFLVVAHVAMIFGMLDPGVLGWEATHVMPDGGSMVGMAH